MDEFWKIVDGYNGKYEISNLGRVKKNDDNGYKILKPHISSTGYLSVHLYSGEFGTDTYKDRLVTVHRLVAMHFIDNPNNYPIINHKDENKENNTESNLEWCTAKYNVNYSLSRRRLTDDDGYVRAIPRKLTRSVNQITLDGVFVMMHDNVAAIKKSLGYNAWSISQCCNGKRKSAYGYVWEWSHEPS